MIFEVESADRLGAAHDTRIEVWASIAVPPDRAAWAEALTAYEAVGATGVIVPCLLIRRGVPIESHSRKPLRALMPNEKAELDRIADELLPVITR